MMLFKMAGIDADYGEVEDSVVELLLDEAHLYLRAGGALSFYDWCGLDKIEKACFAKAGDLIKIETALKAGLAAQGINGIATVGAEADDGKMKKEMHIKEVMEASAAKRQGKAVSVR